MARKPPRPTAAPAPLFDIGAALEAAGMERRERTFGPSAAIFSQGDLATEVFYIQHGRVKLSVLSRTGKEAVVAVLGAGDFFGEGCLAAQYRRIATASAMDKSTVIVLPVAQVQQLLHDHGPFADRFVLHMLARNIRIEEDLVDQLFNSSEKRLARILLLLARYGTTEAPLKIPRLSQETLAEMVGTTRSRVNFFMNKFRDLGFIEYDRDITVHNSLLTVVLHD